MGREAAGAIDIVPFQVDVPQLGRDAAKLQVMDQIVVAFLMKEVVVGRAFGHLLRIHRIAFGVYRFDDLIIQCETAGGGIFYAAICKEFLCGLDLRIQTVHFRIVFPLGLQVGVVVMEIGELRDIRRQCFRRDLGNIRGVVGAIHFLIVPIYRHLISCHSVLVFGTIRPIGILGLHGLLIGFEHILQTGLFFLQHLYNFPKAFDRFGLLRFQRVQCRLGGFDFRRASGILHQDECISVHVRQSLLYHLLLQELHFRFVACLGRRIGAVFFDLFLQRFILLIEIAAAGVAVAETIGNISVAGDRGDPLAGSAIDVAAHLDGFISMDTGLRFAIHFHIGSGILHGLPDGDAFAEDFLHRVHPGFGFAVALGSDFAGLGFEGNIPITLQVCGAGELEIRLAIHRGRGVVGVGKRHGSGIQDIASRGDFHGAGGALGVAAGMDGDVTLRRLGAAAESGGEVVVVSHLIGGAGVARQAIDIHHGAAIQLCVIPAADGDGTAAIGAAIGLTARVGVSLCVGLFDFLRVPGLEVCAISYSDSRIGGDGICILRIGRHDCRAGGKVQVVFGNHFALGIDVDGILIVKCHAGCLFGVGEVRRIGFDGDLAQIHLRTLGDGGMIHHADAAGKGRTDDISIGPSLAILPSLLRVIEGENFRLIGGGDGRAISDGDMGVRLHGSTHLAAGATG